MLQPYPYLYFYIHKPVDKSLYWFASQLYLSFQQDANIQRKLWRAPQNRFHLNQHYYFCVCGRFSSYTAGTYIAVRLSQKQLNPSERILELFTWCDRGRRGEGSHELIPSRVTVSHKQPHWSQTKRWFLPYDSEMALKDLRSVDIVLRDFWLWPDKTYAKKQFPNWRSH